MKLSELYNYLIINKYNDEVNLVEILDIYNQSKEKMQKTICLYLLFFCKKALDKTVKKCGEAPEIYTF